MFLNLQNTLFVLATAAGQDLFSKQWTEGDLHSIQPIVNVLSTVSVWVISIVGFGIVIFSILKNAMSGLYVVNPNFFDRVSEVKNQAVNGISNGINDVVGKTNGNVVAQRLGTFTTFMLKLIPDVRALTDFDGDGGDPRAIDKKQYFMRSIPLLVAQIFIGTFIFLGYPSKVAEWVGEAGTYAIDAFLNNADPVTLVQRVSDKVMVYSLATDGSPLPFDKNINSFTTDMLRSVQSKYPDMEKDPTQEVAYALESFLQTALAPAQDQLGAEEGYSYTCVTTYSPGVPTIAAAFQYVSTDQVYPLVRAQATNGTIQWKTWINASSLPTGLPNVGAEDYFMLTVTATPEALSSTSRASMIVCAGCGTSGTQINRNSVTIPVNGFTIGSGSSDIHGTPGAVSIEVIDSTGASVATASASLDTTSVSSSSGMIPVLVFDQTQFNSNIRNYLTSGYYLRVTMSGTWTITAQKPGTQNTTTVTVSEFRLTPGSTSTTYAISTWPDFTLSNNISSITDPYTATTKQSMSGVAE